MEQIAADAEEAAGGSQEQLAAIKSVLQALAHARGQAETSRRRTEALQVVLAETSMQITTSVRAIQRNSERQQASPAVIEELSAAPSPSATSPAPSARSRTRRTSWL